MFQGSKLQLLQQKIKEATEKYILQTGKKKNNTLNKSV